MDYAAIPSPFYRVSLKAIIFDEQKRLLVVQAPDGLWEMPGGGWEHDEALEACLEREIEEELGVNTVTVGEVLFVYRGQSHRGYQALRIAIQASLSTSELAHGKDMIASKFITKAELAALPMAVDEAPIKDYAAQIWPTAGR